MKLFIETEAGKLQNLFLLQDVRALPSEIEPEKFALAYIQENGTIIEDVLYDTIEEAEEKAESVREELLSK